MLAGVQQASRVQLVFTCRGLAVGIGSQNPLPAHLKVHPCCCRAVAENNARQHWWLKDKYNADGSAYQAWMAVWNEVFFHRSYFQTQVNLPCSLTFSIPRMHTMHSLDHAKTSSRLFVISAGVK